MPQRMYLTDTTNPRQLIRPVFIRYFNDLDHTACLDDNTIVPQHNLFPTLASAKQSVISELLQLLDYHALRIDHTRTKLLRANALTEETC